jgi:hypothetical protein
MGMLAGEQLQVNPAAGEQHLEKAGVLVLLMQLVAEEVLLSVGLL